MSPEHEHVVSLLGAWALDACSDEEIRLITDHIARCPACAEESLLLGGAADLLGDSPPLPSLRQRTLAVARARRPPAPAVPPYAAPYAAQVSVLDALLSEVPEDAWSTTVIYDWTVQDVLAHLSATDALLTDQLAAPTERANAMRPGAEPDGTAGSADLLDVDARTALVIARERTRGPAETREAWRGGANELCTRLRVDGGSQLVTVRYSMRLANAIVARAFETWIHTRDIALAVGRSLPSPLPDHLHAIADLGVRVLPAALALHEGSQADGESVRIDLSGPGGGVWDVPLGAGAAATPTATVSLSTLEFCLLAADRLSPAEAEARAELSGNVPLARRILAAAPSFAGP